MTYLNMPQYKGGKDDWLISFLKQKEGFRKVAEKDPTDGIMTVGYGFTDPTIVSKYTKRAMTEAEADNYLRKEVATRRRKLEKIVPNWNSMTDNQKDSLTSYYFNFPFHNDPNSKAKRHYSPKLFKYLSEKNWKEAAKQIDAGMKQAKGLRIRRLEEQEHFLGGPSNEKITIPYPERTGNDYNYARANQLGYRRDRSGHLPTRDDQTGMYLKMPSNPTYLRALAEDASLGYIPTQQGIESGDTYTDTWQANEMFGDYIKALEKARTTQVKPPRRGPDWESFFNGLNSK